jgi:hypothetical protein
MKNKDDMAISPLAVDSPQERPLHFTCVKCGGEKLELMYDCLTACQEVTEVREDGTVYVTGPIEVVEDNGHWYRCLNCKASLVNWETGDPVWTDDSLLAEWLLENCPQSHGDVPVTEIEDKAY